MKKVIFLIVCLLVVCCTSAQDIWHRPDSLLTFPLTDSIPATDKYSVYVVLRSLDPDTSQLLWGITENDTLRTGILTDGLFTEGAGIIRSDSPRDFSHWSIYYYHTGCRMDTSKRYALHLGAAMACWQDSVPQARQLTANIAMDEFAYFSKPLRRTESASFLTYLALKYGITLDGAPYVTPQGDTLWSVAQDRNYYHRVTGIGADSVHQWTAIRSESKEGAEMRIVCQGLREGEYMLAGDNDGGLYGILQANGLYRMERQWRLRKQSQSPQTVTIEWNARDVNTSDSMILVVADVNERETGRYLPAHIVGDSVYVYPLTVSDTLLTLQLESPHAISDRSTSRKAPKNNSPTAGLTAYYGESGRIVVGGLSVERRYDYYLYDSSGKLVQVLAEVVGNEVLTGTLPPGVYHIEVVREGVIVGDVRIIVK